MRTGSRQLAERQSHDDRVGSGSSSLAQGTDDAVRSLRTVSRPLVEVGLANRVRTQTSRQGRALKGAVSRRDGSTKIGTGSRRAGGTRRTGAALAGRRAAADLSRGTEGTATIGAPLRRAPVGGIGTDRLVPQERLNPIPPAGPPAWALAETANITQTMIVGKRRIAVSLIPRSAANLPIPPC